MIKQLIMILGPETEHRGSCGWVVAGELLFRLRELIFNPRPVRLPDVSPVRKTPRTALRAVSASSISAVDGT